MVGRPYDDVVDITLRAAEGALCGVAGSCGSETSDPNHGTPYTDGARAAGRGCGIGDGLRSDKSGGHLSRRVPLPKHAASGLSEWPERHRDDATTQHYHAVVSLGDEAAA